MKQSLLDLKQSLIDKARVDQDSLVDLGSWHESLPGWIFQDPVLDSYARNVYCIIKIGANKNDVTAFPDYNTIIKIGNIGSKSTIASCLKILRLTRWVARVRASRGKSGRFKSNLYVISDEPLSVEQTSVLDDSYFDFVLKSTKSKDQKVQNVASDILENLNQGIAKGKSFSLDEKQNQLYLRDKTHDFVQARQNNSVLPQDGFFGAGLVSNLQTHMDTTPDKYNESEYLPGTSAVPGKNELAENTPGTPSVLGSEFHKKQQLNPSTLAEYTSSVLRSSSCNINNTTTTTDIYFPEEITNLNKNEQFLIRRITEEIEADYRQLAVNELNGRILAGRTKDRVKEVDNPVRYFQWLRNEINKGNLDVLSSYSTIDYSKQQDDKKQDTAKLKLKHELQNSYAWVEQCKKFCKSSPDSEGLSNQLLDAERKLNKLRASYEKEYGRVAG